MKQLILFTAQFPYKTGDACFVINEIYDLAQAFSKIYLVVLENKEHAGIWDLPNNVELIFKGFSSDLDILTKGLFNFTSLITVFRLFISDLPLMRRPINFRHFLLACLYARALAANKNIRQALSSNSCSLYFFWGTGCAYILPFLKNKLPTTIRLHRGDLYLATNYEYLPFRRAVLGAADALITISADGENYLKTFLKRIKVPTAKVSLIKLGTRDFGVNPAKNSKDYITIVSCSSLIPIKRVTLIFEVMRSLALTRKVHWLHFGDGPEMPVLQANLAALNMDNLSVDLRGYTANEEIMTYYQNEHVDLFINLSSSEGIPVSIMEATAFNIPVLATAVGGSGELVGIKLQTGLLVAADVSVEQCVQHIIYLLENKELFKPREYWQQQHSADVNNKRLLEVLNGRG